MRSLACLGSLLLLLCGCAQMPQRIVIELDGVAVEIKPKPAADDDGR